jgi:DNA polymerase-3 subunit alpha
VDFVHLHVHSNYSLLQGALTIEELIRTASDRAMTGVALTDTNGLYGAMFFYEAARDAGLKPIIGTEIVAADQQCICLAADRQGYGNLCRIVTERRLAGTPHFHDLLHPPARLPEKDAAPPGTADPGPSGSFDLARSIGADPEGLFVLTATPSLLRALRDRVPPGRLYAELRADGARSFETSCPALRGGVPPRADPHRTVHVASVAEELDVPLVATVNVNFAGPDGDGRHTHAVLSAIRENVRLKPLLEKHEGRLFAGPRSFLQPADQLAAAIPPAVRREAMRNTLRIADACNLEIDVDTPRFPRADLPPGVVSTRRLRRIAFAGARQRYGWLTAEVRRRLDRELEVIRRLNFCDYFLVVRDVIGFAEREGIPHVGRGSAANSIVSYCLGISAVDPIRFGLPFERFLNEFRTDVPDIDIDFCWRRRDDVIDYVYRRYGKDKVAMVATHNTLRARSAFRDVARVMGLPQDEIDTYSKMLPYYSAGAITEVMETFPEMAGFPMYEEPWKTVVATALKIDGCVRHLGIHLGGLVIGDRPLTWYTPLENSAKGIVITQYEMKQIEKTGLVKMDLLGQRSLSIVAEAAGAAEKNHGVRIDLDALPDRDPRTAVLLRHGRTMGCFQIESPGMRQLLQMLRAESITDLIQGLSLIRPGPSSSGMKHTFIRRRCGEEPVTYPAPLMEKALGETYGVMLYQEDILRVAEVVAGFTLAEGDELRKAISKKRSRETIRRFRQRFVSGAMDRGVDEPAANEIWRRVEDFAAYSYCKAHATTYGHISYQATYLKAHYPAEFLAAVIANKAGFYDPRTYVQEARRFNVQILPPCVNNSDVECRAEVPARTPAVSAVAPRARARAGVPGTPSLHPSPDADTPLPTRGDARNGSALRPGLEFVAGLSRTVIRRTLEQRTFRPFESIEDYCARVRPSREELENLIACGAFDCFGITRPTLMLKAERLRRRAPRPRTGARRTPAQDGAAASCTLMAASALAPVPPPVPVPDLPEYPLEDRVLAELRVLGFSHSGHPLDAWEELDAPQPSRRAPAASAAAGQPHHVPAPPRVFSYDLARHVGRRITFTGWLVTTRRAVTRDHQYMMFLTLEDRHGVVETVMFPDVYRQYGARVTQAGCYSVTGEVKSQHGSHGIMADAVRALPLALPTSRGAH